LIGFWEYSSYISKKVFQFFLFYIIFFQYLKFIHLSKRWSQTLYIGYWLYLIHLSKRWSQTLYIGYWLYLIHLSKKWSQTLYIGYWLYLIHLSKGGVWLHLYKGVKGGKGGNIIYRLLVIP
jgi:hypothetical protein